MKKALTFFIITVMLLLSALPAFSLDNSVAFFINYPEKLPNLGEEFEVSVDIFNNPGVCGIQFTLGFDKEVMLCEKVFTGELLSGTLSAANPENFSGATVAAASVSPLRGDERVATYEFIAKEDIEKFDFSIIEVSLVDENGRNIGYTVLNGETDAEYVPEAPEDAKTPAETETVPFGDVENHWAKDFISKSAELGLFKGDETGNFNPDEKVTRAQFITVLWRMANRPEPTGMAPFEDIENEIDEFKKAISWGFENGYINGTSEKTFDPKGAIKREESMKILHFYSGGMSGGEVVFTAIYDGLFEDSKDISSWAKPSIYWGIYNNILSGTSESTLSPKETATRAELAKILVNYLMEYRG